MSGELVIFLGLAAMILGCATFVVFGRNPVACAIALILKLFTLAGVYALIGADFLAAIQVIVYAGAIMVLFVFVIMLLNVPPDQRSKFDRPPIELFVVGLTAIAFIVIGVIVAAGTYVGEGIPLAPGSFDEVGGNTLAVGKVLFAKYIWPFELASLLILMAIIASIVIARKQTYEENK